MSGCSPPLPSEITSPHPSTAPLASCPILYTVQTPPPHLWKPSITLPPHTSLTFFTAIPLPPNLLHTSIRVLVAMEKPRSSPPQTTFSSTATLNQVEHAFRPCTASSFPLSPPLLRPPPTTYFLFPTALLPQGFPPKTPCHQRAKMAALVQSFCLQIQKLQPGILQGHP